MYKHTYLYIRYKYTYLSAIQVCIILTYTSIILYNTNLSVIYQYPSHKIHRVRMGEDVADQFS